MSLSGSSSLRPTGPPPAATGHPAPGAQHSAEGRRQLRSAATQTPPSTAAVLDKILDQGWLTECTGWHVRAFRLRVKPGVSVLMGLEDRRTGCPAGWARILWPSAASKERKTRRLLDREGRTLTTRRLEGGLVMLLGHVDTDPWLITRLARARHLGRLSDWGPHDVLRYNPGRRLVLRQAGTVVRIRAGSAERARYLDDLHRAIGALVPVPTLLGPQGRQEDVHVSVQEHCGRTDLAATASLDGTHRAGGLLAVLHAGGTRLPAALREGLGPGSSPGHLARTHASVLEALAPDLARRVLAVASAMPDRLPGGPVLAHGDASPDQFLDDPATARTWMTDFDRVCLAPPATDLGSYLSVASAGHREALLEGYAGAGGALPPDGDLEAAVALSRLSRLADPLRSADPRWRQAVTEDLERLEEQGPWND